MKNYLYKQFYRNRAYIIALLFLFVAGIMAIYTGKKFLDKNQEIIAKTANYQKESIEKNVKYHKDDLGLILYYIKFNLINETPRLAALNIGMRDIKPSIQGVTIRNLEEQRYNADFYNPANAAVGNFDFSFVLVFLFPLIIVAFCYNLISEEEESGRWKLLSVQSSHLGKLLDAKLLIRFLAVSSIYILLIAIAVVWISIPVNMPFIVFILSGWLYILFWFVLSRWIISFRRSSAENALILLIIWVGMNFIIPMGSNMLIQKYYPVQESLKAVMQQREGYHNKWDELKLPTMEKFYKAYPQFKSFKVEENDEFTWIWYYAMQHMGDLEASLSSKQYIEKMQKRNKLAEILGHFLPNVHTQLTEAQLAKTGMENQLHYGAALQKFHEEKRLSFYPLIFSGQNADAVNWDLQTATSFGENQNVDFSKIFLPYIILIILLIILSQYKFRKLC
ncbi:ABC-2 family transporter protein [compost metagenome]